MRLVEFGVFPTEAEMVMWQANCDTITQQLELRFGKSADNLVKDEVLIEILNTIVERMPRESDIFRTAAIKSNQSFINTKTTILNATLKICQSLTKSLWKNLGYFEKPFFLEIITLYPDNEKEIGQVFEKFLNRQLISKEDVVKYLDVSAKQCLEDLIEYGKELKQSYEKNRTNNTSLNIIEYLVTVGSIIIDFKKISEFAEKQKIEVENNWNRRIPSLFESIYSIFDYPTLFEVASNIDGFPLRKVFEAKSFTLQKLVECFDQKIPQNSIIFTAYSNIIDQKPIENEKVLFEIREKTVDRLRKCGYFENLGISDDSEIQNQISYVSEMFPHLSPHFIHLVLRHFSFNAELTVSNLLTGESIPLEFKFIESNIDWNPSTSSDWPPLDFTASDEIERALYDERKRKESEAIIAANKKPGLFSLAHGSTNENVIVEPVSEMSEMRRKAQEYKANVFSKLNKIREPQTAPDGEVLVPMESSKVYSALNNLKMTTPEMVAIRPTYDKYKYEIPNENGMYDDEYDDEFEERVFNIERLNEELESSSEEEEIEEIKIESKPAGKGNNRGNGNTQNRNQSQPQSQGPSKLSNGPPPGLSTSSRGGKVGNSDGGYTGGRNRQLKERHKADNKQRGADRKNRAAGL
ncbi:unnamed protein product [Caenorhabditis angaria]|uniref:CUE domain-containing protein n=1 Tax=Caenorhabditis angaria TaxID=860376 RepID=A0A9P1MT62_9PELO|nr:unnamed protein product [Caenorhabditis angaria]